MFVRFRLPALAFTVLAVAGIAHAQPVYKVAFIDPLSGPYAAVGELTFSHVQFAIDLLNAKGGTQMELLRFDSKLSAQESQSAMQAAIDQGARAIVNGASGTAVSAALVQTANKWNERNPGKEVLVFNHGSLDPDLTGKDCSFWFFSTEANTAMKMKATANLIKTLPEVKKIYLLNQDYANGRQWAAYGSKLIGEARPDIEFVGETFHPLGRVKDFTPYIAKAKQAGADSILTANWGQDLSLLLRSAADAGYDFRYFTSNAAIVPGTTLAIAQAKRGQLTWVSEWHPGEAGVPKAEALAKAFKAKTGQDYLSPRTLIALDVLKHGIDKANSTDSVKVARALEGFGFDSVVGPVEMRAQDHQLLLPQVVSTVVPVDGKAVKEGWEGTNYGFRTDAVYSAKELEQPSVCKMVRP